MFNVHGALLFHLHMLDLEIVAANADMGKSAVEVTPVASRQLPDESIQGMLKVIHGLTQQDNGRFCDSNGKILEF